jgi:ADP-ribosylglycohydrolase
METIDRFRGCMIGLAIGDAFGSQLEHARDPFHAPVVFEPPFRTSDDTALAMAVGRGLLAAFETGRDPGPIRESVLSALITWYHDPVSAANTPDPTTWTAIERIVRTGGKEGVDTRHQPTVVAVRAVPVGLAYAPSEVVVPARAVTCVTHQNATAVEAAVFTAWLTSSLVRGAPLTRALVEEGREMTADLGFGGALADSIADALGLYGRLVDRPLQWLPVDEITPGDGGWCAESAVGLALVAALLAPKTDVIEGTFELAARIHGDSDGVAALAGAWVGAARGSDALPFALVEPLEALDVLVGLADGLHRDATGLPDDEPPGRRGPRAHIHHGWNDPSRGPASS